MLPFSLLHICQTFGEFHGGDSTKMTIFYNILVEFLSQNVHSLKSCKFLCGDFGNLLYS